METARLRTTTPIPTPINQLEQPKLRHLFWIPCPPLSLSFSKKKKKNPGMFVVPPLPHVKIITLLGKFSLLKTDKPIKMILKSKKKCCFQGKKNNVNKHKKGKQQ